MGGGTSTGMLLDKVKLFIVDDRNHQTRVDLFDINPRGNYELLLEEGNDTFRICPNVNGGEVLFMLEEFERKERADCFSPKLAFIKPLYSTKARQQGYRVGIN